MASAVDDDEAPIVIDIGTDTVKAGFADDENPRREFPTLIGRPKSTALDMFKQLGMKDTYVGDEAKSHAMMLTLSKPIQNGLATNWEDMEKLLHHTLYNNSG